MKYSKITTDMGKEFIVRDNGDNTNSFIPLNETNSDYQAYLAWLENPEAVEHLTEILPTE